MLLIDTRFHPYRMNLKRREPVQFDVEITNKEAHDVMVTLELALTRDLSFDRSGLKNSVIKRIDKIGPQERQAIYFEIFPKQITRKGEYDIGLKILEHHRDFHHIDKSYIQNLSIIVDE